MKLKTFYETYHKEIIDTIDRYSQIEGERLAQIVKGGNHYQINNERENLDMLSRARMILRVDINEDAEE